MEGEETHFNTLGQLDSSDYYIELKIKKMEKIV